MHLLSTFVSKLQLQFHVVDAHGKQFEAIQKHAVFKLRRPALPQHLDQPVRETARVPSDVLCWGALGVTDRLIGVLSKPNEVVAVLAPAGISAGQVVD